MKTSMFIFGIFASLTLSGGLTEIQLEPIWQVLNADPVASLVNSVDFHPTAPLFCVTFTQNNRVVIYQLNSSGEVSIFQGLENPSANLSYPQHALFSKDGKSLVVANWVGQTFTIYPVNAEGFYEEEPIATLPFFLPSDQFRPHGMAFSPDGDYLAVAFGASKQHPRAVALYAVDNLGTAESDFTLESLFQGNEIKRGIPKGVAFSPDGSCLLVTLSETHSIVVYGLDWENRTILPLPRQTLKGKTSQIGRPEDIKFTAKGDFFAVSNSSQDTITFYPYDAEKNVVLSEVPSYTMQNPAGMLKFPHGLAFSSDGQYLSVTQFGSAVFDKNGHLISWGKERLDLVSVYRMK